MIKNKYLVKVNGVTSLEQAKELNNLGVDLFGLPIRADDSFGNIKIVSKNTIDDIKKNIDKSKLVGCLRIKTINNDVINIMNNFDCIQQQGSYDLPANIKKDLYNREKKLIFGNIEATYDTAPSRIVSRYLCSGYTWATFYEVILLGNISDSRRFLKEECPEYKEELQIEDVNSLGRIYPIVVSLDFDENNILEILDNIPNIKGIVLTIDNYDLNNVNQIQLYPYEKIIKLLKYLEKLEVGN